MNQYKPPHKPLKWVQKDINKIYFVGLTFISYTSNIYLFYLDLCGRDFGFGRDRLGNFFRIWLGRFQGMLLANFLSNSQCLVHYRQIRVREIRDFNWTRDFWILSAQCSTTIESPEKVSKGMKVRGEIFQPEMPKCPPLWHVFKRELLLLLLLQIIKPGARHAERKRISRHHFACNPALCLFLRSSQRNSHRHYCPNPILEI